MSKRRRQRNKQNQRRVNLIPGGTRATALTTAKADVDPLHNPSPTVSPLPNASQPTLLDGIQAPPALHGGRQTQPSNVNPLGLLSYSFLPRRQWQAIELDSLLSQHSLTAQQILEMLADISPEVSQATANTLRMVNSQWSYDVRTPNNTSSLKKGKQKLDELISRINPDGGGLNAIIDSWSYTGFLQGAMAGEIALTEDLADVQDIYAVQPWTIHFQRDGRQALVPFQLQVAVNGQNPLFSGTAQPGGFGVAGYPFRRLNPVTFGYMPIDAGPDDPYGRPPAAPVLQLIAFQLSLMRDIRQWVHTNAFGRLHIKVLTEMILKAAPDSIKNSNVAATKLKFVNDQVKAFQEAYNRIKPDDAFVTTDAVELGAVDQSGKTFAITDTFVRMLERQLIRALKQLPILMGSNEGSTETHGTVQLAIYVKFIESLQHKIATMLEKFFNVALQVYGINGKAHFEFEKIRSTDRLLDVQADQAEAAYQAYLRDQGWITQDEASIAVTGSEAVEDEPLSRQGNPFLPTQDTSGQEGTKPKDEKNGSAANKAGVDPDQADKQPDGGGSDGTAGGEEDEDVTGNKKAA